LPICLKHVWLALVSSFQQPGQTDKLCSTEYNCPKPKVLSFAVLDNNQNTCATLASSPHHGLVLWPQYHLQNLSNSSRSLLVRYRLPKFHPSQSVFYHAKK